MSRAALTTLPLADMLGQAHGPRSKYGAQRTASRDGLVHDSKAEARRWDELCMLQKGGAIHGLQRQVPFELAPSVKYADGKRARPALRYVADFRYYETKELSPHVTVTEVIVEDVKGVKTAVFEIKRHLMKAVHNIEIRITK